MTATVILSLLLLFSSPFVDSCPIIPLGFSSLQQSLMGPRGWDSPVQQSQLASQQQQWQPQNQFVPQQTQARAPFNQFPQQAPPQQLAVQPQPQFSAPQQLPSPVQLADVQPSPPLSPAPLATAPHAAAPPVGPEPAIAAASSAASAATTAAAFRAPMESAQRDVNINKNMEKKKKKNKDDKSDSKEGGDGDYDYFPDDYADEDAGAPQGQGEGAEQRNENGQSERPSDDRVDDRVDESCRQPAARMEVSFFIPYEVRALSSFREREPKNDSCVCGGGSEYIYSASSRGIQSVTDTSDADAFPIGALFCTSNENLCVDDVFGRQWRPARAENLITVVPTTYCASPESCEVYLLFTATQPSTSPSEGDLISGPSRLRFADMNHNDRFRPFTDYLYLPIRGMSCNSCREMKYCRARQQ